MPRIEVNVTEEHLLGKPMDCFDCPIFRALLPIFGERLYMVGVITYDLRGWGGLRLPQEVTDRISGWDDGEDREPFTFILEVPEGVL